VQPQQGPGAKPLAGAGGWGGAPGKISENRDDLVPLRAILLLAIERPTTY